MADQVEEILEVPREFFKDGVQFINRCQKRTFYPFFLLTWRFVGLEYDANAHCLFFFLCYSR